MSNQKIVVEVPNPNQVLLVVATADGERCATFAIDRAAVTAAGGWNEVVPGVLEDLDKALAIDAELDQRLSTDE